MQSTLLCNYETWLRSKYILDVVYVYTPPSVYTQKIVLIDESQEHKRSPHEIQVVSVCLVQTAVKIPEQKPQHKRSLNRSENHNTNEAQTAVKTTEQTKSKPQRKPQHERSPNRSGKAQHEQSPNRSENHSTNEI